MTAGDILLEATKHVTRLLNHHLSDNLRFHNLQHTREVVMAAVKIGHYSGISAEDAEIIKLAALFHDTGFTISYQNHEEHGMRLAKEFLESFDYDPACISKILDCIGATKLPQRPQNLLEAILCDADMYHLSTRNYWKKNQLLKEELSLVFNRPIRNDQWYLENLNFLSHHHYHTPYGLSILASQKAAHLKQNIEKLKELTAL
ncbi:HD domain-containing protein [Fulvivirgaceae bacterium BMA12]|uniref:HD domain-containing protein n=1 Tax=Agaribacillus aureus TaxID=3051825 RepID=A0ABT8LCC3_9BACT|nr:HD domain-containing protein [Fulvivirgaceae bacterium BMA12]